MHAVIIKNEVILKTSLILLLLQVQHIEHQNQS